MAKPFENYASPHEVTTTDFKARSSLLPINEDGLIVDYDGVSAGEWKQRFEQRVREDVAALSLTPRTVEDRVRMEVDDHLASLERTMTATTAVIPIGLPATGHWIVAFNAPVFLKHQASRADHRRAGVFKTLPSSVRGLFGLLDLEGSDGDPVRHLHNTLCNQARENGLIDGRNDPRLSDPLFREQAGLDPQPASTTPSHGPQERRPGSSLSGPTSRSRFTLRTLTAPSKPLVSPDDPVPIDREARRRAYEARRASRPVNDDTP